MSQKDKIITILALKGENEEEYKICLRNLELLAKRVKIKEIWIPRGLNEEIYNILLTNGYKETILGIHPELRTKLIGMKKLL